MIVLVDVFTLCVPIVYLPDRQKLNKHNGYSSFTLDKWYLWPDSNRHSVTRNGF